MFSGLALFLVFEQCITTFFRKGIAYEPRRKQDRIRQITLKVLKEHNVLLTAVGVYSVNTKDPKVAEMREKIRETVLADPDILQMHGFYVNEEKKTMRLDLVVSFDARDRQAAFQKAVAKIREMYPEYALQPVIDTDFSET